MGIVLHLANMLERTAKEQHLKKIRSVTLQVGEVSGIMTGLFTDCWDYFKVRKPLLAEAALRLETLPAVTWCDSCRKTYETVRYGRQCPYCQSTETWLLNGRECIVKELEAETEDEAPAD